MKEKEELKLQDLQKRMLEMMLDFDKFCGEHKLRYYLGAGTLLGAIRHKGFIPWDDDTDLLMFREDYERLLQFSEINDSIKIVSYKNPNGCYHPFCYINLVDKKTVMHSRLMGDDSGKGVFVDIFPLDYIPSNKFSAQLKTCKLKFLTKQLWFHVARFERISNVKSILKNGLIFCAHRMNEKKLISKIDKMAAKKQKTNYHVAQYTSSDIHIGCSLGTLESFEPVRKTLFEGHRLNIPKEAEHCLKVWYGDYMKLPPESERKGHHFTRFYWKNNTDKISGLG